MNSVTKTCLLHVAGSGLFFESYLLMIGSLASVGGDCILWTF